MIMLFQAFSELDRAEEDRARISPHFTHWNLHFGPVFMCHCLVLPLLHSRLWSPYSSLWVLGMGIAITPWHEGAASFSVSEEERPAASSAKLQLLLLVAKLRKLRVWFSVRPVLGGRFALSGGKCWLRVLVQPSSEHLDWADVLRRQKWATGLWIHGEVSVCPGRQVPGKHHF